jgi:flagellar hook-length control protein FliK
VNAFETDSKTESKMQDVKVGSSVSFDRGCVPLPEVRKTVGRDAPIAPHGHDGVAPMRRHEDALPSQRAVLQPRDALNYTECKGAVFDRGVTAQEANTTATGDQHVQIVNAFETDSKTESKMQDVNVGSSVPLDRGCLPLPEVRKTVGREAPIAPHGHDGVAPMRRHEDALPSQCAVLQPRNAQNYTEHKNVLPSQNLVKPHEMPSDSHDPVQVIAPAPLPIELPAATVQHQSAAAVATPDTVKMFVAAAEAVADAILVSSGFENGEGRILVRLQPEVLGGSEIQITVKGGTLTVVVNPASQDVQTIVEANRTQFEQHLAEKVHSWRISVAVKKGVKIDERV